MTRKVERLPDHIVEMAQEVKRAIWRLASMLIQHSWRFGSGPFPQTVGNLVCGKL